MSCKFPLNAHDEPFKVAYVERKPIEQLLNKSMSLLDCWTQIEQEHNVFVGSY